MLAASVLTAGPANAQPSDCTVDRTLTGASATCLAGTWSFFVVVDCIGIYDTRGLLPLPGFGPYKRSGNFAPVGGRSDASCTGNPLDIGIATDAHVELRG
jgi:hypothetical protein